MPDKRVIEQPISNDVYGDDWFLKDSPQRGTTRISKSDFLRVMSEGFEGIVELTQAEYDALPSTKYNDGILYAIKDSTDIISILNGNICNVTWTTTGTYTEGDYVLHDMVLYICSVTTATTGTWVDAEWTRTSMVEMVLDELDDIPDRLDAIEEMEPAWTMKATLPNLPKPIATIPDGANAPLDSLKASIVGVQDLHGYDHPWPAGGGKNKAITKSSSFTTKNVTFTINSDGSIKLSGTADETGNVKVTDAITIKAGTTYTASIGVSASVIGYGISGFGIGTYTITPTNDYPYACIQVKIESGTTYNTTIYPQIELGSTATSYEPYENICPISGWSEASVTRTGKNLYTTKYVGRTYSALTFSVSDGVLSVVGSVPTTNVWSTSDRSITESECIRLKAGTYTINKTNVLGIRYYPRVLSSSGSIGYSTNNESLTFSLPSDTWFYVNVRADSGFSSETPVTLNIQIERGEEETTFEPYSGQSYTIPFKDSSDNPINVYRGTIDITTGVATFTHKAVTYNGSESWRKSSIYDGSFYLPASAVSDRKPDTAFSCNMAKYVDSNYAYGTCLGTSGQSAMNFWIAEPNTTLEAFQTWLSTHNLQVEYELATPITMQFDPIALRSNGVTNISVNCGEVTECKYIRDATTTINDILARLDALEG